MHFSKQQSVFITFAVFSSPLAESYVTGSDYEAGATAELADFRKQERYANIDGHCQY